MNPPGKRRFSIQPVSWLTKKKYSRILQRFGLWEARQSLPAGIHEKTRSGKLLAVAEKISR